MTALDTTQWGRLRVGGMPSVHFWPYGDEDLRTCIAGAVATDREPIESGAGDFESGIVVLANRGPRTDEMLETLRSQDATRLLPVAVVHTALGVVDNNALADAHVPLNAHQLSAALVQLGAVEAVLRVLPKPRDLVPSERRELDLVRYLYAREHFEVRPRFEVEAKVGFRYPLVETLLGLDAEAARDTLEEMVLADLLDKTVEEQVHLCSNCGSCHVLFREICPACHKPTLEERPSIHHFRCAHVDSVAAFRSGRDLVCPKCHQVLRHIGVDYDMPDSVLACGTCARQWVEGTVETRCLQCDDRADPSSARRVTVSSYRATSVLSRAAFDPVSPLSTSNLLLSSAMDAIEPAVYQIVLDHTLHVSERFGRPACVVRLDLGRQIQETSSEGRGSLLRLIDEVAEIVRSNLRDTDVCSVTEEHTVDVLLPETDESGARVMLERVVGMLGPQRASSIDTDIITLP